MSSELLEYLRTDLFLQQVVWQGYIPYDMVPVNVSLEPDVLVLCDYVWRQGDPEAYFIRTLPSMTWMKPPSRILVVEGMEHDGLFNYIGPAGRSGLRLHRGKIFNRNDGGADCVIEFHRKDT